MKARHALPICALILAAMTLTTSYSWGQADPSWLRSWNEAQERLPASMTPSGRIAPKNEPGVALIIHGRLFKPDGTAAQGVTVHAYHRDREGFDFGPNDNSLTTWRLQGWVKTDADGRFEFQTIRPAPDHLGREGSHIHFTLESVEFGRQWAPTVFLSDDPLVTADQRRRSKEAGDFGSVRDIRTTDGVQHIDVSFRVKEKADF